MCCVLQCDAGFSECVTVSVLCVAVRALREELINSSWCGILAALSLLLDARSVSDTTLVNPALSHSPVPRLSVRDSCAAVHVYSSVSWLFCTFYLQACCYCHPCVVPVICVCSYDQCVA